MTSRFLPAALCCAFLFQTATAQFNSNASQDEKQGQNKTQPVPLLFQVSTLDALSQGVFEGAYTVGDLKKQGDFGLGTYDGLEGEMVVLDGHYYHAYSDGSTREASDKELAPFAAVTFFQPQKNLTFTLTNKTMAEVSAAITAVLPSANLNYAIRITGHFAAVQTRAIPKQSMPYQTLAIASESESIFNYSDLDGTAVVIHAPAFEKGINVVGDHFHFVSKDHSRAGHALSLTTGAVTVEIMPLAQTTLWLPTNSYFLKATLPYS